MKRLSDPVTQPRHERLLLGLGISVVCLRSGKAAVTHSTLQPFPPSSFSCSQVSRPCSHAHRQTHDSTVFPVSSHVGTCTTKATLLFAPRPILGASLRKVQPVLIRIIKCSCPFHKMFQSKSRQIKKSNNK